MHLKKWEKTSRNQFWVHRHVRFVWLFAIWWYSVVHCYVAMGLWCYFIFFYRSEDVAKLL